MCSIFFNMPISLSFDPKPFTVPSNFSVPGGFQMKIVHNTFPFETFKLRELRSNIFDTVNMGACGFFNSHNKNELVRYNLTQKLRLRKSERKRILQHIQSMQLDSSPLRS